MIAPRLAKHVKSIEQVGGIESWNFQTINKAFGPPRALLDRADPLPPLNSAGSEKEKGRHRGPYHCRKRARRAVDVILPQRKFECGSAS